MKNSLLLKSYIGFSAIYLIVLLLVHDAVAWFLKPFLLPFLLLSVYRFESFDTKKILLIALFFSWMGDVVLLFADKGELYFIIGLVLFLISHLCYIGVFLKQKATTNASKLPLFWVSCVLVLLYLKSILEVLFPTLGTLKIPVTIYAATISVMLVVALKGYFSWQSTARYAILIGAVCFVVSDSLLAIDKFHSPLPHASFVIMFTYLLAQFLITLGILKLNVKK
jgi:uncharacterized membrane protein YhhN